MSQHIRLHTFLPYPIAEWVRNSAADHGESVSIFTEIGRPTLR